MKSTRILKGFTAVFAKKAAITEERETCPKQSISNAPKTTIIGYVSIRCFPKESLGKKRMDAIIKAQTATAVAIEAHIKIPPRFKGLKQKKAPLLRNPKIKGREEINAHRKPKKGRNETFKRSEA